MIDIEHPFLYDRSTFPGILEKNKFDVLDIFSVTNRYPFSYWLRLAPVTGRCKQGAIKFFDVTRLGRIPVALALGNMGLIARVRP